MKPIAILAAALALAVPSLAEPVKLNPIVQQTVDDSVYFAEVHTQGILPLIHDVRLCTGLPQIYPRDWYVDHADDMSLCVNHAIQDFVARCSSMIQGDNANSTAQPCYVDLEWRAGLTGTHTVPKANGGDWNRGFVWDIPGYPLDGAAIRTDGHARMCVRVNTDAPCEA